MSDFNIEQPPAGTSMAMSDYLTRTLINIKGAVQQSQSLTPIYVHPTKFKVGKLYYYGDAVSGDPVVDGEGVYVYKSTGMVKLG